MPASRSAILPGSPAGAVRPGALPCRGTQPVDRTLVRELHRCLMEGVRVEQSTPGEFRQRQNWIGRPGCTLHDADFVPPPVPEMHAALADFEGYLAGPGADYPPLLRLALIHYQFEVIHPFLDGNGRIGRLLVALLLAGCGKEKSPEASSSDAGAGASAAPTLTPEQLRDGIGPVKAVSLPPEIDAALVKDGEEIFTTKCSACHRLDRRYVGPALGQVLQRRTPAYVMNMILNPTEMTQKHPAAHELLATHMTQMPALGLTEAQARSIVEYLRKNAQPETGGTT